jgi:hypothetical protein
LIECQGGKGEEVDGKQSLSLRLVDARSGKVLEEIPAPSSHVLVPKVFSLKGLQGRDLRLELIDIDRRNAYAWIGLKSVKIRLKEGD